MRILNSLLLAASVASAPFGTAMAADYMAGKPAPLSTPGRTPACDDPRVLGQVEDQFEHGAVHMLQTGDTIAEFSDLVEKAWLPREDDASVERRYCQGRVMLTGHRDYNSVYYTVSYPLGFASIGWKAEGCVLGLDKWYVYGANCSSLRRF